MTFLRKTIAAAAAVAATLSLSAIATAGSFDSASVSSARALSSFKSVYIAPVNAALDLRVKRMDRTGYGDRPVSDRDAAAKAADFHGDLVRAFSRSFSIAGAPGPDVLTIEATLTHLESSRPTLADYHQQVSLSPSSVYAGGGAVSIALSENGVRLAEVSDSYSGVLTDKRSRAGIWEDADRAFSIWANKLVKFVESH